MNLKCNRKLISLALPMEYLQLRLFLYFEYAKQHGNRIFSKMINMRTHDNEPFSTGT